jgi:glutamate-1-semialdehyde aminotransferase/acyl carrier protein
MSKFDQIVTKLQEVFALQMDVQAEEINPELPFLELGVDSLSLLQISGSIQGTFYVDIPFRHMMEELDTVHALSEYIEHVLGDDPLPFAEDAQPAPEPTPAPTVVHALPVQAEPLQEHQPVSMPQPAASQPQAAVMAPAASAAPAVSYATQEDSQEQYLSIDTSATEWIISQQLNLMERQLSLLGASPLQGYAATQVQNVANAVAEAPAPTQPSAKVEADGGKAGKTRAVGVDFDTKPFVPYKSNKSSKKKHTLEPTQQAYLDDLVARLTAKCPKSKAMTQQYRQVLADNRPSAGFRLLWKEICFPILVTKGQGSQIWDVDGNKYLDIAMGFGSLLFGHSPDFVQTAIRQYIDSGICIGPQWHTSGEAAALLCEITNNDRATFVNSGTEAVMCALRFARTARKRDKIVTFAGSYHGTFDGTLVTYRRDGDQLKAVPMAPGVPQSLVDDVMCLEYDSDESLELIRKHADDLACMIVEPMPSRRPDRDSGEFLRKLRKLADETGIILIFDEVVTGFRMHPGGSQALFNVQADLVTYGKAAGAGYPIGIIAGKSKYMDHIDGGYWEYGDDSIPTTENTYFSGTFFKHPLTMTVMLAVLRHIKAQGETLQQQINARTDRQSKTLNAWFEENDMPIRISHVGSLYKFFFDRQVRQSELFYYDLIAHGVYLWEGRVCYISTAHTDEDVDFLIDACKKVAKAQRQAGLI